MKKLFALLVSILLIFILVGCGGDKDVKETAVASSLFALKIEGASYQTITEFKKDVLALEMIKNVYQKDFNKGEVTEMQVECVTTTQALADALQAIDNDDYFVEILGFDPATVELKLGAQ